MKDKELKRKKKEEKGIKKKKKKRKRREEKRRVYSYNRFINVLVGLVTVAPWDKNKA